MTLRDFNHLKNENQELRSELAALRKSLIHLGKGSKIDNVTGEPLGQVYLRINCIGDVSIRTALSEWHNEESTASDYCIAEAAQAVLRQYQIPLGMGDEAAVNNRISQLHELLHSDLHDLLTLWKACGGSLTTPANEWLQHTPAFKVLKNKGHRLALANNRKKEISNN